MKWQEEIKCSSPVGCFGRIAGMSRPCFHCGSILEKRNLSFSLRHRTTVNIMLASAGHAGIPSTPSPEKRDNPRRVCEKCYRRCEFQTGHAQVADERDAHETPEGKRRLFFRRQEECRAKPGRGRGNPPKNTAATVKFEDKNIETLMKSFMTGDRIESPGQLDCPKSVNSGVKVALNATFMDQCFISLRVKCTSLSGGKHTSL